MDHGHLAMRRILSAHSPWEVLGISRESSLEDAKAAYKRVRPGHCMQHTVFSVPMRPEDFPEHLRACRCICAHGGVCLTSSFSIIMGPHEGTLPMLRCSRASVLRDLNTSLNPPRTCFWCILTSCGQRGGAAESEGETQGQPEGEAQQAVPPRHCTG